MVHDACVESKNTERGVKMVGKKGKRLVICLGVLVGLLVVTGSALFAAEKPPIKVGLLLSYTGIAPLQAKGSSDGAEFAFDEVHRRAGGRAIQVIRKIPNSTPPWRLPKCDVWSRSRR